MLLALAAGCGGDAGVAAPRVQVVRGTFVGVENGANTDSTTLQVFVVTSHECPIANAYAPMLGELAASWTGRGVEVCIVHADPDLTLADARRHAEDFKLPGTVLLDPHHDLIRQLGATKTPEAIVRRGNKVLYRGRIDDQWRALGTRAQEASQFDLRDAVAASLAGKPIAVRETAVIGCLLPEARK